MIPDKETIHRIPATDLTSAVTLVDVRTPEAFAECHIPGSVNHCVYEVAFTTEFPKAFPDTSSEIVVYGEGAPFKADEAAIGRLQAIGYTHIAVLEGGLKQWLADGKPTEGTGPVPGGQSAGRFTLDPAKSKVRWVGRNLTNQHDGEVQATGGFIQLDEKGIPTAGMVEVDLRRMTCRDITDTSLAGVLIAHLQNADFFDVERFPEASFTLQSATPIEDATVGQPRFSVTGTLSARGQSIPMTIDAIVEQIEGGLVFQANFDFDRVDLGAVYGSGRLFERLGMHLVNDLVSIDVCAIFVE
jgi:polyisoprenoid-binding protein YceI